MKLCDFGSVHSLDEPLPKHIGTGNYKAPELYFWKRKNYHHQHRHRHSSLNSSASSPSVNVNQLNHPITHDNQVNDDVDHNADRDELFDNGDDGNDSDGGYNNGGYESEYDKLVTSCLPSQSTQLSPSGHSQSNSCTLSSSYSLKKADIWSLGVSLFCMLTGHFPVVYDASSSLKICHVNFPIIDADCADLVQKMLQFNPYQRPSIDEILSHRWLL